MCPMDSQKIADTIVHHSIDAKKGQKILVSYHQQAKPLVLEVYKKLIQIGCFVTMEHIDEDLHYLYYKYATKEQIEHLTNCEKNIPKEMDAKIVILGEENTKALANISPEVLAQRRKVIFPLKQLFLQKPWVLVQYPTKAYAQDANMSLPDYQRYVEKALLQDWDAQKKVQQKLKKILDKGNTVRIEGDNTKLTFSIKKRTAIMCYGKHNLPDGEVFIAPVENTTQGTIYYDIPTRFMGQEVSGISLVFEKGQVIEAKANINQKILHAALSMDEGARRLGEFGIGTNTALKTPTSQILLDEKMQGTIHLALGMAYKEGGGKNKSNLHWDMIKNVKNAQIFVDDKIIIQNGTFTF